MSIFKILEKNIEKSVENYTEYLDGKTGSIRIGSEFMIFSLANIFSDKDIDDIERGIVDSSYKGEKYDFGIDAVYITASGEFLEQPEDLDECNEDTKFKIQIFQFKRGTGISQADMLKFKSGIKKVLIDESISDEDNLYFYNRMQVLNDIKESIFERFPSENISVVSYVVFGGVESTLLSDKIVSDEISNIEADLNSYGYTNSKVKIVDCQVLIRDPSQNQSIVDVVEYEKTFKYITDTSESKKLNGYISIFKGEEIAGLVRKHQEAIFEANIRDYFRRSDLNSKIIETSSDEAESKYFWSFNNGLTMTCSKVEELPGNKYKLHNLQIVNGCQTSNAIYNAVKNKERVSVLIGKQENNEQLTIKEKEELDKIKNLQFNTNTTLLVKIIETKNEDLIYRITETTNSQTPIKAFSLRANDDVQKQIEKFLEIYDISYERRINELRNKGKKNIYSIQKLFQLYTSHVFFMPSQAKTNPKRLFVSTYDNVFPDQNIKRINFLLYYIPILIDINVNIGIKKYGKSDKVDAYKKTLFAYGKFHLGCFLLSSILKSKYSEKGIVNNEEKIRKELEENLDVHFFDAMDSFEKVIKKFAGNKKESIIGAVRKPELDNKIAQFVKGRK